MQARLSIRTDWPELSLILPAQIKDSVEVSCACFVKSFVFDKVPERTLKLTTIGQRRKVIAYCWADGKLLFLTLPASLKGGQACQNMIMGLTLRIYTKRTFLMDGI